jgi:glycosyltransferase involved in cell wall biosynthesis
MSQSRPTPMFSVIVCTQNRASLLLRALGTVVAQTYDDFEVVVVDDGSTDGTRSAVASLSSPRVRYVHQDNQGISVGRNTGVANSFGRYVVYLDDDDLALPTWLERLSRALDDCAVVCCGELVADDNGGIRRANLPRPLGPAFADCSGLFQSGTFAVRRDAFDAVGGYLPGLPRLEHTEFALRLLPYCVERGWGVRTVDEALVQIHVHGPGGGRHSVEDLLSSTQYILEHHGKQLGRSSWLLSRYAAVAGVSAARLGDYRLARRYLRQAIRAHPRDSRQWLRLALASVPPAGRIVWGRRQPRLASMDSA